MKGITAYELIEALKFERAMLEVKIYDIEEEVNFYNDTQRKNATEEEREIHHQQLRTLDDLYSQRFQFSVTVKRAEQKYKEMNEK